MTDDALYGAQTRLALQNFPISGRTAHSDLTRSLLWIKRAAASANAETHALSEAQARSIHLAVDELLTRESEWPVIFPVDPWQAGAGTSQNMNVNEVIAHLAKLHPNDHVNRSQSTNDVFPTAMRLALLIASRQLIAGLQKLSNSLNSKAAEWKLLPKAARTHLQDAVPMRLGQEASAWADTVSKCARWLGFARDQLREIGLGGSAAGTGLNVPAGYIPAVLGELERLSGEKLSGARNLCEAMQSQAAVTLYSSLLRLMALELTRICNDLRLLASGPQTGLAEIILPTVQAGSSIMPGKVNPSILEMANQAWFSVIGLDQTVALASQAGQLELNVMMPVMAYSTLEATQLSVRVLAVMRERCIDGMRANEARLRKYYESTPQIATALSPKLGYEKTAELVQESQKSGRSVVELAKEQGLVTEEELSVLLGGS